VWFPSSWDFAKIVERELAHHETLLCELYQGGSTFFDLWVSDIPEAMPIWREHVKDLQVVFKDLGTLLNIIGGGVKRLEGNWGQRILTLGRRVEDLVRLLELDASNHNWRDLMWTLPMLQKSRRLPHQRYYFLAKKEMLKLTGTDLLDFQSLRRQFDRIFSLQGYKIPLLGEDIDELSIAQRLSGTLDDDRGDGVRDQQIRGPSTGIFDLDGVKNLVGRLNEEHKAAQRPIRIASPPICVVTEVFQLCKEKLLHRLVAHL